MKNRTALITGGLGDIGTAICHEFINQGATVIVADHLDYETAHIWQQQQQSQGYTVCYTQVDVADFDSCKEMATNVGPVDILVNAAGTIHDASFRKMTSEQWGQVVHTNLDSMFNVTKQFIEGMIARHYGRIINISSVTGEKGQFGQTNYAASKSGVYGFTKSLAQEVSKYGITVNSISPGFVESKMVFSIPDNVRQQIIENIPVKRLAQPREIAWAIAFLASERSGFVTGSNLSINGGIYM